MKTGPSQDDQTLCGGFSIHGSGLQRKQSQTHGIQLGYKAGRLRRQVGEGRYKKSIEALGIWWVPPPLA